MFCKRIGFLFICLLLSSLSVWSQPYQTTFGKNRVQYKNFDWQVLSTYNFDVYFYEGGKDIADLAIRFAEHDFERITSKIGFYPYSKIKLIIYNSVADLQQSNIGLVDEGEISGGHTNFVKSKIEVAFQGIHADFRKEISFEISRILVNTMMYGGSLKEVVQSSYLLALPDWYVSGIAAYLAEGWSIEMDDYIRDAFATGRINNPSGLSGQEADMAGHSIWNFISQKFGESNISNLLNLTRILRNEEHSIESTFGLPYSIFIREWKNFYRGQLPDENLARVSAEKKLEGFRRKETEIYQIAINREGTRIAYVRNYNGKYKIRINDLQKDKSYTVLSGGYKRTGQKIDAKNPVLAWQTDEILSVIEPRKGRLVQRSIDVTSSKKVTRRLDGFSQVLSLDFSEKGGLMLMSADKKGQSDIFLFDLRKNTMKQLTNDIFDDLDPKFISGTDNFIFSSNRKEENSQPSLLHVENRFNLFLFQSGNPLKQLTSEGNNLKPTVLNKEEVVFLNDRQGIFNLYKLNLNSGAQTQISGYSQNILDYGISANNNMVFTALRKGKKNLFLKPGFRTDSIVHTKLTHRQAVLTNVIEKKDPDVEIKKKKSRDEKESEFNLNDFNFESEINKETQRKEEEKKTPSVTFSQATSHKPGKDALVTGPYTYNKGFSADRIITSLMIDPLRGLGVLMESGMSDLLGNHRINVGLFGLADLKSSNLFGEYMYLKKRVDFKARIDRKTLYAFTESVVQRYTLNQAAVTASYPFSVSSRVSISPFLTHTRNTDFNTWGQDKTALYKGLRGEYVFDNTLVNGLNMIEGTRGFVGIEQYVHTSDPQRNFGKFMVDLRKYQRVHKDIILATRVSYGAFFGNAKKNFLLGGMNNWMFNVTDHSSSDNPLALGLQRDNSDLMFLDFATPLRGFVYNTQFGPKHLLGNAELRIPLVKYFYNGVVASSFLRNFQVIAFTDAGSAWSGSNPFSRDNSINKKAIGDPGSPFNAEVNNYTSPFLLGYGFGARTLLLGYYMKLDVAWGRQDNQVLPPRYYFTFGFDF